MAEFLHFSKGKFLNFTLTFIGFFFFLATGWGQTVTSDKEDYAPGETAIITGTGWAGDTIVNVHFNETPEVQDFHEWHDTPVDSNGNFVINFPILEKHLGVAFEVEVVGTTTGRIAYAYFTDGIDAISILSPLTANPTEITSLPNSVVVNFNYSTTQANQNGTATVIARNGTTEYTNIKTIQAHQNQIPRNDQISVQIPSNAPQGSYDVELILNQQQGSGPATKTVTEEDAILVNLCTAPSIVSQPLSETVTYGENAIFSVNASGVGNYQWQEGVGSPIVWSNISDEGVYSGATTSTLTLTKPGVALNGRKYRIVLFACTPIQTTPSNGNATLTVDKKDITGSFTAANKTYDGTTGATVLSRSLTDVVGSDAVSLTGGTATFADANAGTGKVVSLTGASLSGDDAGNYNLVSVADADANINKADATVTVAGTTVTYDGNPHGASGTAVGVNDEALAGLDLGASFTNVPGGTANWTFTDVTGNYEDESGSVEIVINKADATVTVAGTTVTYDGNPHGASGTAVGVNDEALAGLDLGASFTNVPGGTANWTFTDVTGNYEDESGSVEIVIGKADATIVVNGYNDIYDGAAHGASGTAVGVNDEPLAGLDLGASFTNVGSHTANWTFTDATGNYNDDSGSVEIVIGKADATIVVNGYNDIYDGAAHGASGTAVGVNDEPLAGLDLGASFTNVGSHTANWTFTDVTGNYNNDSGTAAIVISQRPITITPVANQSKFCGQDDETFDYTSSETLIADNSFSGSLSRVTGEEVGFYSYLIGDLSAGNNYTLTLGGSEKFEIKGVTIDASASSNPVAIGSAATLRATVLDQNEVPVEGVLVYFYFDNELTTSKFAKTDANGVATLENVSVPDVKVYKVTAVAGEGCSDSVAYLPVYDPTAGFVTGGGWIWSPKNALAGEGNENVEGKANFGFVAKYKKGKTATNEVDGNTEFQFKAGDLNFKSQLHESGSLVISGGKATYRGEGTINGSGTYKFTLVAIDGDWNKGTGPDKFRIKIWGNNGIIYDNGLGADDNSNDATELGGGSIVIHEIKGGGNNKTSEVNEKPTIAVSEEELIQMDILGNLAMAPNPVRTDAKVRFSLIEDAGIVVRVFDFNGREVGKLFSGTVKANQVYEADFQRKNLMSGVYLIKLTTDRGHSYNKQIIIE
ncbi:YDG domain-containing protein [Gillisia sp. Q332]|uniref:YDG domain-containing protein n=1 Tax=Gillisia xinjiangensis TaxID=3384765 RepID=UPI0039194059